MFGPVENAYRIVSLSGRLKRYGFVSYKFAHSAAQCIQQGTVKVGDHSIFCHRYDPGERKSKKRKTASLGLRNPEPSTIGRLGGENKGGKYFKRSNKISISSIICNKSSKVRLLFKGLEPRDLKNMKSDQNNKSIKLKQKLELVSERKEANRGEDKDINVSFNCMSGN